jgi:hypothetical protein
VGGAVFGLGATLGMTDDEAYYWILSQRMDWGYAYHPPMIAWWIHAVRSVLSPFLNEPSGASVQLIRFSSALLNGLWIWVLWRWWKLAGPRPLRGLGVFLCFGGLFSVSWMMVPDLPLVFGILLAFTACWRICFEGRDSNRDVLALGVGLWIALLSKISAVLFFPGVLFLLVVEVFPRDRLRFWRAIAAVGVGGFLGVLPTLIWNAQNDWVALSYQLSERHQGEFSWIRALRAWGIQALVATPAIACALALVRRAREREARFFLAWMAPTALVFLLQPLRGEFKPHWLLMAWIFPVLWISWRSARENHLSTLARAHVAHGILVFALFTSAFQYPWITDLLRSTRGEERAALLDISNDLRGWSELRRHVETFSTEDRALPWVGARYQTASQAAFALGDPSKVTLIPQHRRDRKEWPDLAIGESVPNSAWPRLLKPVLFVADLRYSTPPGFLDARCESLPALETRAQGLFLKRISLWKCVPTASVR